MDLLKRRTGRQAVPESARTNSRSVYVGAEQSVHFAGTKPQAARQRPRSRFRSTDDGVTVISVTRYRFLDGMGDCVDEREFAEHAAALAWARDAAEGDDDVQRVEYLGPEGDWRWAGPLLN